RRRQASPHRHGWARPWLNPAIHVFDAPRELRLGQQPVRSKMKRGGAALEVRSLPTQPWSTPIGHLGYASRAGPTCVGEGTQHPVSAWEASIAPSNPSSAARFGPCQARPERVARALFRRPPLFWTERGRASRPAPQSETRARSSAG